MHLPGACCWTNDVGPWRWWQILCWVHSVKLLQLTLALSILIETGPSENLSWCNGTWNLEFLLWWIKINSFLQWMSSIRFITVTFSAVLSHWQVTELWMGFSLTKVDLTWLGNMPMYKVIYLQGHSKVDELRDRLTGVHDKALPKLEPLPKLLAYFSPPSSGLKNSSHLFPTNLVLWRSN